MNPLVTLGRSQVSDARYPQLWRGLVGAWLPAQGRKHNSLVLDYSGNGNHGTLTNGAAFAPGRAGYGGSFDGSNDYVVGANAGINFPVGGSRRSLALWMKSGGWSGDNGIFHWGTDGGSPTDANIHLVAGTGGVILWGNGYSGHLTSGSVTVNDSKWHHIVGTYDGTNGVIWIDGRQTQSSTWTPATLTGTNWRMGSFMSNAGFFPGVLSDVLLYNRLLQPAEIRLLATGSNPFEKKGRVVGRLGARGYSFASAAA